MNRETERWPFHSWHGILRWCSPCNQIEKFWRLLACHSTLIPRQIPQNLLCSMKMTPPRKLTIPMIPFVSTVSVSKSTDWEIPTPSSSNKNRSTRTKKEWNRNYNLEKQERGTKNGSMKYVINTQDPHYLFWFILAPWLMAFIFLFFYFCHFWSTH